MWKRLFLAVFILLAFEAGLFLLIFPWSEFWEKNYFLTRLPMLRPLFMNAYMRGAVSGLGLVNLLLGVQEAWHFRRTIRALESGPSSEKGRANCSATSPADSL